MSIYRRVRIILPSVFFQERIKWKQPRKTARRPTSGYTWWIISFRRASLSCRRARVSSPSMIPISILPRLKKLKIKTPSSSGCLTRREPRAMFRFTPIFRFILFSKPIYLRWTGNPFLPREMQPGSIWVNTVLRRLNFRNILYRRKLSGMTRKLQGKSYVTLISLTAGLGGFLFGFDTAVISGAINFLREQFHLNSAMEGWIMSSALAGCVLGAACAGWLADRFGRKKVLLVSAVLFILSAAGCVAATTTVFLVLARMLGGVGVGFAALVAPMFISELSPAAMRGRLVSL